MLVIAEPGATIGYTLDFDSITKSIITVPSVSIACCTAAATSSRSLIRMPVKSIGIGEFHIIGASDGCLRIVARVEKLLPLAHHAQIAIVHNGHFDGDALLLQGRQFLNVHLNTTIARHYPDGSIRHAHLDAHRSGERKAHGTKPTRGDMAIGARPGVMTCRPHLVLSHIGDDNCLAICFRVNRIQDADWIGIFLVALNVLHSVRYLVPPRANFIDPGAVIARLDASVNAAKAALASATIGTVATLTLCISEAIDIDMDDACVGSELADFARDAIIETQADANNQVGTRRWPG